MRQVQRDDCRRRLATNIVTSVNGPPVEVFDCSHDAIGRPVSRNGDAFGYNARSEVIFSRRAAENAEETYSYDEIGNLLSFAAPAVTNAYAANNLNQYVSIYSLCGSAPLRELSYDPDGNLTQCGDWTYTYDAANHLVSVSSTGNPVASFAYDAQSRRVKKVTPEATHTYFYDGWNLVEERMSFTNGTTSTIHYHWGKDLSGSLQDAGGIGGLLYISIDGALYVPCYDNNGNITRYLDSTGSVVATYIYDSFGRTLSSSGPLANVFRHRFSTKCFDPETGLYYYGYRFYSPKLMRWLNRDPIEEAGGLNLYAFVSNSPTRTNDPLGETGCECFSIRMELVYTFTWDAWITKKHEYPEQIRDGMTYPYSVLRRGKDRPHFQMFSPAEYAKVSVSQRNTACCNLASIRIELEEVGKRSAKRDTPFRTQANQDGQWGKTDNVTLNIVRRSPGTSSQYRILAEVIDADTPTGKETCSDVRFTIAF